MTISRVLATLCVAGATFSAANWGSVSLHAQDDGAPPTVVASVPAVAPTARRTVLRQPRPGAAQPGPTARLETVAQVEQDGFGISETRRYLRPVLRVGADYVLAADSEVSDVSIILGTTTISGRVTGDLVVVMGDLHLSSTAVVSRSAVVVGGKVTIDPGASINGDMVVVGGVVDAPPGFAPAREHVVIGPPMLGQAMRAFVPWLTQGLMWGRVLVPSVAWLWWIVAVFLAISIVLVMAFPQAVTACTRTLSKRPLASFVTGMLTLLLAGPLLTLLAVSVVGIIVIPFVVFATIGGWMIGKVAVARLVGSGIISESDSEDRLQALRSLLIGFAIITLAYMVPVLGIAAWTVVGVLGVGTGTLTLLSNLKRERPAKPAAAVPPSSAPGFSTTSADAPVTMASDIAEPAAELRYDGVPPPSASSPALAAPAARFAGDMTLLPRASFLDRLAAFVLDLILVGIAYNILDFRFFRHRDDDGFFLVLFLAYRVAFWAWKSTTIGGIICNLRIIRMDGQPLQPVDAVVRGLVSILSAAALMLGYLWVALDSNKERQTWHDKVAGTLVVRVPRDHPGL